MDCRDGEIGSGEEGSICENEICTFDLRAGAAVRVDHGYEKVKLIQFGARFDGFAHAANHDLIRMI